VTAKTIVIGLLLKDEVGRGVSSSSVNKGMGSFSSSSLLERIRSTTMPTINTSRGKKAK